MTRSLVILIAAIVFCGCASGPSWKRQSFAFSLAADPPTTNDTDRIVALNRVSISPTFQSRSFTYRTGDDSYEQDPYAGFLIPPERALAEAIRASMRASGAFGRVVDPGSAITPNVIMEASINELYGDFRQASRPVATMGIHMMCYEVQDGEPRHVLFDKYCLQETALARKTPGALMTAWDEDLRQIMDQISSEYAKTISLGLKTNPK
jgi:cholesterol transport system auxiliary component